LLRRIGITISGNPSCVPVSAGRSEVRYFVPSFSRSLELALTRRSASANDRDQEFATLEHLLLALLDDKDAAAVMRACNVNLEKLKRDLTEYIDTELGNLVTIDGEDAKPTAVPARHSARRHSRAVLRAGGGHGRERACRGVAERESHAAYFLQEQDMTRYDAVNYISHGSPSDPVRKKQGRARRT
jgi:ATP-dependent Clp protease ATP-binding subunit ClpA